MSNVHRRARMIGIVVLSIAFGNAAFAGDFTPPPGPVGATMKSLETIEPRIPVGPDTTPGDANALFVISAPGSYYLTGDVVGVAGKDGIRIDVSQVSLDLGGFAIRGVPGSLTGIACDDFAVSLGVANGVVSDWDGFGIEMTFAFGSRLSNLVAERNGSVGIYAADESTVRDCRSRENAEYGFFCNGGVAFEGCSAAGNGMNGFHVPFSATLINCHTSANGAHGFLVVRGSLLNCLATANTEAGFSLGTFGEAVTATNCTSAYNAVGFEIDGPCVLAHCSSSNNSEDGFRLLAAGVLDSCSARDNVDDGFQLGEGALVMACSSIQNAYGFYVPAAEANVRIDSCSAILNSQTGILVTGSACLVVRNMARDNGTNTIFSAAGQNGTTISANGTITADPWANFTSSAAATSAMAPDLAGKEAQTARQRAEFESRRPTRPPEPNGSRPPARPIP